MQEYAEAELNRPYTHLGPLLGWADATIEIMEAEGSEFQFPPHQNLQEHAEDHHLPEDRPTHPA